jgi:hypothetical protein
MDASEIIVAGPRRDLIDQEAMLIREYLNKGGKALVMLDPPDNLKQPSAMPNITGLLKDWGVTATNSVVVDVSGRTQGGHGAGRRSAVSVASDYRPLPADHDVPARAGDDAYHREHDQAGAVLHTDGAAELGGNESRFAGNAECASRPRRIKGTSRVPSRSRLRSACRRPTLRTPSRRPTPTRRARRRRRSRKTRLAAFGDSDFAANSYLGIEGNRDLFMNTVNWLAQQENLIAIRPKEASDRRITMTGRAVQHGGVDVDHRHSGARVSDWRLHVVAEAVIDAQTSAPLSSCSSSWRGWSATSTTTRRSRPPVPDTKQKAFSGMTADAIEELQIKAADGETSRVQKSGDQWKLTDPVNADADSNEVSSVTTSLASLDINRVIDENPSNLKEYGLDPARIEVSFRAKDQKDFKKLLVGERTPTGSDLYAQLPGEKRVFLINSFNDSTFNKNTFALREKKILKIDRAKSRWTGSLRRDQQLPVREERHGLADRQAGHGASRVRSDRGNRRAALDGANAGSDR